ncbi:MAG: hypothetical protein P4L99_21785 [Chthoniobacter sp.]|nr:hypothetical protein [Chthoniobacter sp.]
MNAPATTAPGSQKVFDFESLLGSYRGKTLLTVPEACAILRRKRDFVIGLIDSSTLHGHTAGEKKLKDRKTLTTRSVALHLVESALYEGGDYEARVRDLFATWTTAQRRWAIEELSKR